MYSALVDRRTEHSTRLDYCVWIHLDFLFLIPNLLMPMETNYTEYSRQKGNRKLSQKGNRKLSHIKYSKVNG